MRRAVLVSAALALPLAGTPQAAAASSAGPVPGQTGVPAGDGVQAEPTCTSCHASFPLNPDDGGGVSLAGLPERYEPGARYPLVLSVTHPDAGVRRWGFQLTAVTGGELAGAGTFVVTDPANVQRLEGGARGREYVEHTYPGTAMGRTGGAEWRFDWVAPERDVGDVLFFGAANAADMDGSQQGDRIYNPAPEPLAAVAAPGGGGASEEAGDGRR